MTTLVLLHAFPLDASMYDRMVPWLSGNVTDVLVPSFPGFGGRHLPDREPSLDVYADDVAHLLDEVGSERVVLGGTSMGGYTTMAFLRRHPDRVAGLVLIDTKASADADDAAAGRRAMADRLEREATTDALLGGVYPKLLGESTFARRTPVADEVRRWVAAAPPPAAAWAQRAMADRPDSFDTLRSCSVPALVVVGEQDVLSPPVDAQAMVEALPDAELVVVPDVGHLSPVEAPEIVADAVARFVTSRMG